MPKLIECVPNFSEGRDESVISRIAAEITAVGGVTLLGVDPGKDTNRTVVTFVGEPEPVLEAAFRSAAKAAELVRMTAHKGAHPRMGATDVIPVIPVSGVTMEECVAYAKRLGSRIGEELGIPVFLYAEAAQRPDRSRLPDIRAGEYEGLAEKLKRPDFKPDFGPAVFNPESGATAVGARDFMIAYNVNLNTKDAKPAREIAMNIRESGRIKRGKDGKPVTDGNGNPERVPGKLQFCQAGGWTMDLFGYAQVTMNLHNFHVTGLHHAFDAVADEADKLGLRATGSELVGLVPLEAMLDAGAHYLRKQGKCAGAPEPELVHTAILSLGMNDTYPFKPEERIIEYAVAGKNPKRLAGMTLTQFADELSSDSPAPGGGSVAALAGALSAGLSAMVASLTYGKKEFSRRKKIMEDAALRGQELKKQFVDLVDRDTEAFNAVLAAMRLPKKTDAEKSARDQAIEDAYKLAASVPMETLRLAEQASSLALLLAQKGIESALSDAAVASLQAGAAAEGAWMNVAVNLQSIKDAAFASSMRKKSGQALEEVRKTVKRTQRLAQKRLGS
jgi:glutamate formiminotransferase/formiminotetrahydrofolate cyclodeaminase